MIKRPKPGEDEEDILRMQEEFLRSQNKNPSVPSAQVINLRGTDYQTNKRPNPDASGSRKPSKYAQEKALNKKRQTEGSSGSLMGDILEKNLDEKPKEKPEVIDDDKVYYPQVIPSVLGNIVEKNTNEFVDLTFKSMPPEGFPKVTKWNPNQRPGQSKCKEIPKQLHMEVDQPSVSGINNANSDLNLPTKSYIVSTQEADVIHHENIKILNKMSEKEILVEQEKLLSNLDPKMIDFIKRKRKLNSGNTESITAPCTKPMILQMDTNDQPSDINDDEDNLWENDVLSHPEVNRWLHFDSLEKDKMQWMKGIEESKKIKANEPYEARFDFKGYLLPYSMEYNEDTKTLYHHGEEPHRPGYSLTELIELSRSAVIQQRVMVLNTIAGILEYYSAGTYKDIIEIPLSKIFFVIRIAMDENKVILLEPALKALRNLVFNRIDEACLDALVGFEEGTYQPCLENDKSEIQELDSHESDLKDFHLAEIDLIAALLRTDIFQRIFYILDTIKPSFNCVQYALQILTRLARDSTEVALKIVQTEHLMHTIIKHFIPTTGINFVFQPDIIYNGKPILAALKLMRVLSLQCTQVGELLISKYNILVPISEYVSSGVDGTYTIRLQMEAVCILSNLLYYGLGVQNAISLCPVIVTILYKHVHGTDIFASSLVISATHSSVVLQFVNQLLKCRMNLDQYKQQIYPLLKDGVQKWLAQISQSDSFTCGHLRLLCSALDCCKTVMIVEGLHLKFLNDSLNLFLISKGFKAIMKHLILSSNLLSGIEDKDLHLVKNLMSLGGSVIDSSQKVLPILCATSPIPFLASLYKLLAYVQDVELSKCYLEQSLPYLKKIANRPPSLCQNWFTRMESDFLFNVVKLSTQGNVDESKKDLIYAVANKLCYILRIDKQFELEYLFDNIIFNNNWFTTERLFNLVSLSETDGFSKTLTVEDIKKCYSKVMNFNSLGPNPNIELRKWQEPILPRDWIYLPILSLYSKSQEVKTSSTVAGKPAQDIDKERELIVKSSLEWIIFNELCFPDLLNDINVTDRFCRIMCVFLCDNSLFLDKDIKMLLSKCTQILFKKGDQLNFDKELTGLNNFQDFYTQFLEQFQSVSYGDHTFAASVLVPLAQRHNVKWRKILWSEYAGCLRALDCPENLLCYDFKEYLYPEETDESLLKCYFRALSSHLLRPDTIVHKIARHHVECYKKRDNSSK